MKCPQCLKEDTKVLESRLSVDAKNIRRRRACKFCDYRFTTYEREESPQYHIKKRQGHVEAYQKEKILRSIQIACQKRPIKLEDIEFIIARLESKLTALGQIVVSSKELGHMVMQELSHLDAVAYIRFASVYKEFKDPNEFYEILNGLIMPTKEGRLHGATTHKPTHPITQSPPH